MLTQDDAWKIARKLKAEIKTGRRHELAIFHIQILAGQALLPKA